MGKFLFGKLLWGKLVTGEVSVGKLSGWGNWCWGSCDWVNCVGEVALGKWPNYYVFKATNILRIQYPWTESGLFGLILRLHFLGFISPTGSNELDTMYVWMNPW